MQKWQKSHHVLVAQDRSPASSKRLQLKLAGKGSYLNKGTTTADVLVAKQMVGKAAQHGILYCFQEMKLSFPNDYQPLDPGKDREMSQTPSWEELKRFISLPAARQLSAHSLQYKIMVLLNCLKFCQNMHIRLVWQLAICCTANNTCNRMGMIIFKTCISN